MGLGEMIQEVGEAIREDTVAAGLLVVSEVRLSQEVMTETLAFLDLIFVEMVIGSLEKGVDGLL
jgi:hypothetical protein